jgi:hypothetical protein
MMRVKVCVMGHGTALKSVFRTLENVQAATRRSAVSERADIPLMRPIFSSELPASLARTSKDAPVCPLCPETLVLGNSKMPMCALAQRKCRAMHGRSQKGCWLIAMLCIHPCIPNGTLSLRNRALGTVKVFSFLWLQVRVSGAARLSRAPKKVLCSAKPPSCAASHLLLCFCRRILVAYIFIVNMYCGGGLVNNTQQHTNTHTHTNTHIILRCLCGVRVCLMV